LRVAILSLIEPAEVARPPEGAASAPARGLLRLGGHALARHQLGLALALGAERVICLIGPAAAADPDLLALQHAAEGAGAIFHRVGTLHGVLALVAQHDEVIAIDDGVLAWPDTAMELLASPAVLVQPVDIGLARGLSGWISTMPRPARCACRAAWWSGWARCRPTSTCFPPCNALPCRPACRSALAAEAVEGGRWARVVSEDQAHALEPRWIALHAATSAATGPMRWLAALGMRTLGPALLHAGSNGSVVAVGAAVLAALALVAGWFGWASLGLGLCALSAIAFQCAALFGRFERRTLLLPRPRRASGVYGWVTDGALLLLLTLGEAAPGEACRAACLRR
jgi:hypothetical protein